MDRTLPDPSGTGACTCKLCPACLMRCGRRGRKVSVNTFSIVGSVTYVGMLLFLSLLTEDAKLLLTPWSQHHPSSCHSPGFHRSNLWQEGGEATGRGHKGCPRAATRQLRVLVPIVLPLLETLTLCLAPTPEGPPTTLTSPLKMLSGQ